ncbi:MAG: hypothetical protein RJA98_2886 [Pseudomonadota bacterium]|jgi:hypothetical protein
MLAAMHSPSWVQTSLICVVLGSGVGRLALAAEPGPIGAAPVPRSPPAMVPVPVPAPQTVAEFLDSLSDAALGADRSQIYRIDGQRRSVKLSRSWMVSLDEASASRLRHPGVVPSAAGPAGRIFELLYDGEPTHAQLYTQRDGGGRESGVRLQRALSADWGLRVQSLSRHGADETLRRHDAELALRRGDDARWIEGVWRRASLDFAGETPPTSSTQLLGLRAGWAPPSQPGLTVSASALHAFGAHTPPDQGDRARSMVSVGADWQPGWAGLPSLRLYARDALRLGLLASDGLDERATYRRQLGAAWSDGTPGGSIYTEWRQHSLSDDRDQLAVFGWQHRWQPEAVLPGWTLESLIERAEPLGGPSAIASTTLGLRARHSVSGLSSINAQSEWVRSSVKDSVYLRGRLVQRLSVNTLSAWGLSLAQDVPKDPVGVPVTGLKASAGWGWREPEAQRWNTLWRYTLALRSAQGDGVTTPGVADRRAHIGLAHLGWQLSEADALSLRGSLRFDRDESWQAGATRRSELWVWRGTHMLSTRWSMSLHAASLRDDALGRVPGWGGELGLQLSRKASLALGYNPRGVNDTELALDDRLERGVTLRLRFSIENALAGWLDRPWQGAVHAAAEPPW